VNSVLSYIAGFVVLVLFAALVGPSIVDWNSFRDEIELQVSNATGRPVSIGGDINFVILPAPRFSLQAMSVGSTAEDGAHEQDPLAEIGRLEGEVALAPLLQGEIEVTRIRVLDFAIRVRRDEFGRFNWDQEGGQNVQAMLDPETISLEAAHFENGTVQYQDAENGRSFSFTDLQGDLKAVSLLGPLRFDGDVRYDEREYSFSATVGAFGGERAFPVNFEVEEPLVPWRASFAGLATDTTLSARLDGTLQVALGGKTGDTPEESVDPVVSLQASTVISREATSLREIELTAAGSIVKGQAELTLGETPSLNMDFAGPNLFLDRFIEEFEAMGLPMASVYIPEGLEGTLNVAVDDLGLGSLNATDVFGRLTFAKGVASIQALTAAFPGGTKAMAKGELSFVQGAPRFDGAMEATVNDLSVFGRWLDNRFAVDNGGLLDGEAEESVAPYIGPKQLKLQTELALQASLWQAYSLSIVLGEDGQEVAPLTGGISYARNTRPAIGVELMGPLLDLNFLGSLAQPSHWVHFSQGLDVDASLIVKTNEFRMGNWMLRDLDLAATLNDGVVTIAKFEAVNGATETRDDGQVSLSGSLSELGRFASGGIEGTVSASLLAAWARDSGVAFVPRVQGGQLGFVLRGDRQDDKHFLSLDLAGQADGSDLSAVLKQSYKVSDASLEEFDFLFSLENDVAEDLTVQLGLGVGLSSVDGGAFQVQVSGLGDGPYDANARIRAGETLFSTSGTIEDLLRAPSFVGRFEVSSGRAEDAFAVAGWQSGLSDLIAANGREGAVIVGGGLEWSKGRIAISDVEAVAGTFRMSGSGAYLETDAVPRIDAAIDLGRLDLSSLFATEDGSTWGANPLNWQPLANLQGSVKVSASAVQVAGLNFSVVDANASLGEGVLSFNPVTAQFAGGRLTMGGKFEGGTGVPGLGLTIALEDVDANDASRMLFGSPLAEGTATAGLQVQGQGRSLLGLVSTLAGKGTFALSGGYFSGFDLVAFRQGASELATMDAFQPLVGQTLQQGETSFGSLEGAVQLEDGILHFGSLISEMPSAVAAETTMHADLVRLEADIESAFVLSGEPALPALTMVLAGPIRGLGRRTDTLAIQSAVAQALLVREMEEAGVEELPEELRELIEVPVQQESLDVPLDDAAALPDENNDDAGDLTATPAPATDTSLVAPIPAARPVP
jgi:uncharacterized protein involved in outer membrane biogenesis